MNRVKWIGLFAILCFVAALGACADGKETLERDIVGMWAVSDHVFELTPDGLFIDRWSDGVPGRYEIVDAHTILLYTDQDEKQEGIPLDCKIEGDRLTIGTLEYTRVPSEERLDPSAKEIGSKE